ncbi:MAG: class I SAM-dependent methyltransferase [Proteobacteria bacterium]|nr:class I SAM-dependent methyltransferase [Pseudomonadota bacterium]
MMLWGLLNRLIRVGTLTVIDADGKAHVFSGDEAPGETDPWIRKYIFPGGYIPALSEVAASVEKAGLWTTDVEVLRLHYAETIRHWRRRFQANRDKAAALQDERFCRMWEYYLASAEVGFRYLRNTVFQIQLSKRQDAVPLTRDYLAQLSLDDRKGSGRESRHAA